MFYAIVKIINKTILTFVYKKAQIKLAKKSKMLKLTFCLYDKVKKSQPKRQKTRSSYLASLRWPDCILIL